MNLLEGLIQNIMGSSMPLVEKRKRLMALLSEAKEIVGENKVVGKSQQEVKMGRVTIGKSLTLRAALRSLAQSGQDIEVSVGALIRAVTKNILADPMVRNRDVAIRSLCCEAQELLVENAPIKKGSVAWYAKINSGLDPVSGKAILPPVTKADETRSLVAEAIAGVEAAIKRTMQPKVTTVKSPHTKGTLSIHEASRINSGLHPTKDEILF